MTGLKDMVPYVLAKQAGLSKAFEKCKSTVAGNVALVLMERIWSQRAIGIFELWQVCTILRGIALQTSVTLAKTQQKKRETTYTQCRIHRLGE